MKIMFICGNGVSSGMIASKTEKEGKRRGFDVETDAFSYAQLPELVDQFDVVLVAPQMKFNEAKIAEVCGQHGKPYAIIDPLTFATLDGKKCFETAWRLMEERK